jgi:hypothetical protein
MPFDHFDGQPGARELQRRGESVGTRADDDGVERGRDSQFQHH